MRNINKVNKLSSCSLPSRGVLLLALPYLLFNGCEEDITSSQNDKNGDHWTRLNSGMSEVLWDVDFVDANNGWVVGGWADRSIILRTKDGGETWTQQVSPVNDNLIAVDFQDAITGWIAGRDFILGSKDGGDTWEILEKLDLGEGRLRDILFLDMDIGWAVGGTGYLGPGILLKTENGGESWEVIEGSFHILAAISFIDMNHGWISGGGGIILSTKDGGETWEKNKLAITPAPFLTSIQFVDLKHGWTGSRDDWLGFYRTTDGGNSWIQRSWESLWGLGVQTFFFLDTYNGYLSTFPGNGFEIAKTADGGQSWSFFEALDATTCIHSFSFLNKEFGWAVGWDGAIYRYTKD